MSQVSFRGAKLKTIYWIPPNFFANRTLRSSRNPVTRIRNRRQVNGPSLLLKNTLRGLRDVGVDVIKNLEIQDLKLAPYWIPAGDLSALSKIEIEILSESNLTLGPNIDWFSLDNLKVISQFKQVKILVPHHWVISPVEQILPSNCQILVWHSGIDTIFWQKKRNNLRVDEVLIYVKNLSDLENLECTKDYLRVHDIHFHVLKYGSYSQSQFKSILNKVNAAIWIGETESQGLALLECWSMNVPTLVLKKETWYNADGHPYPASSAPYMFDSVGQFSNSTAFSEDDFQQFFSKLKSFSPRESVQESFGLSACASHLFELLEL